MDPVEKAKGEMGTLERIWSSLPGIAGYRDKEMRRGVDKQVREKFVAELATRRNRLSSLQQALLSSGGLLWMDDVERAVGQLQLLSDRARTAAYGYAPFFDLQKIKEDELNRLLEYDRGLFEDLPRLDQAIDGLEKAAGANADIPTALQGVTALLTEMNDKFGRRMQAITDVNE